MNIIVAVYGGWGIGIGGTQPLVISEDRRRFADLTIGGTVVAGRKTVADFPGGVPLSGRRNIVLSRDRNRVIDGAVVVNSLESLFTELRDVDSRTVFVIGGGEIYRLLLPYCNRAYVTKISSSSLSDTFFPCLDTMPGWVLKEKGSPLESGGIRYVHDQYENEYPKSFWKEESGV